MMPTREIYQRARPILDKVLELATNEQNRLVAQECDSDQELAAFIRSLLKRRADTCLRDEDLGFLNVLSVSVDDDVLPAELGSYRILDRLDEGGMGVVFLAEQANPRRLVALKVLRGLAPDPAVLQHEAETLARLQHPGIAQIYEAGIAKTPDGPRAYFAMEFISSTGETNPTQAPAKPHTLKTHVNARAASSIGNRLGLIAHVCDATDYAHKRGVIHRDLKPDNILIDHLGRPKVIDFGIALLARSHRDQGDQQHTEKIAGTLPYMSPEQLEGDASKIDLRSDVYALGVMTYELLAGVRPYDGLTGEHDNDIRILQESEPKPLSARLPRVPRDVEAIVAKAMAKDPESRYQTAEALASDLRRFMAKRPVAARPTTLSYRARCLFRRHPIISVATSLAVTLIGVAAFQAYQESAAAKDALALLLTGMEKADPISGDGSPATLDRLLHGVAEELDQRTALHPEFAAQIHTLLGSFYYRQSPQRQPGLSPAVHHYRRAAEIWTDEYGAHHERTLAAKNNVAMALSRAGEVQEAERLLKELIVLRERANDHHGALITRGNHAVALLRLDDPEAAMQEFKLTIEGFLAMGDGYQALSALGWQAKVLMEAGYLLEAETLQRKALQLSEQEGPAVNDLTLAFLDGLTHNLIHQHRWSEANSELLHMSRILDSSTAPGHALRRSVLNKLIDVQGALGDAVGRKATLSALEAWEAQYASE